MRSLDFRLYTESAWAISCATLLLSPDNRDRFELV
jgi:hypothetical protein